MPTEKLGQRAQVRPSTLAKKCADATWVYDMFLFWLTTESTLLTKPGPPIGDRSTVASGVLSCEAITTGGIEVVPNAAFKRKHGIGLPHASDVYI